MDNKFQFILQILLGGKHPHSLINPLKDFNQNSNNVLEEKLNTAFILALTGDLQAQEYLEKQATNTELNHHLQTIANFYQLGLKEIFAEIESKRKQIPPIDLALTKLADLLSNSTESITPETLREYIWAVFFPEGVGILDNPQTKVKNLCQQRNVTITEVNSNFINAPDREILFTSNVLLTIPPQHIALEELDLPETIKLKLKSITEEPQLYWYDHPIPIGVSPEHNEILYGLNGLDEALAFEKQRGNLSHGKVTCVLSVSVTHQGIQSIAKEYIEDLLLRHGNLQHIDIYVFTEEDTQQLIEKVLIPAGKHYCEIDDSEDLLQVFGIDGEYGRHYSFLKAIAPLWQLIIDPQIKATFKIDLDQVFPQTELVKYTGRSALEHFKTNLWGAKGIDSNGEKIELGMIAGALVNEADIKNSLFTPDVKMPNNSPSYDEWIFFSKLPQAISTEAEMMRRSKNEHGNSTQEVWQRIHVTGGTNGILIESLKRYRCFTPSFIGRAEDQAYILATFATKLPHLAYLNAEGLIMRHDKEAFAQDAIKAAAVGKLIGDYVRVLYFSAYADCFPQGVEGVKNCLQPFTGCFVSYLPKTVTYLRFCLKASAFFAEGKNETGKQFITEGAERILKALEFVNDEAGYVNQKYHQEKKDWELYYDILDCLEVGLQSQETVAQEFQQKAEQLINDSRVYSPSP